VQVLDAVDLPPPALRRPLPSGPIPEVMIITGSAVAPAVVLLRGEWSRRFRSVAGALAWCDAEGWPVENRTRLPVEEVARAG
jgi:hypothetical protein